MRSLGKFFSLGVVGWILNVVWEEVHAVFYAHYQGGAITHEVLLRAAMVDTFIILVLVIVAELVPFFLRHRFLFFMIAGAVVGIAIELWALGSGRWAYQSTMPLIPLIHVGATPTIQLGLTGYAAYMLMRQYRIF